MERLNSLPDTIIRISFCLRLIREADEDIRIEHAQQISELDLDGYAIGGLAVGESHEEMYRILDAVVRYLPERTDLPDGGGNPRQYPGGSGPGRWTFSTVFTRRETEDTDMFIRTTGR